MSDTPKIHNQGIEQPVIFTKQKATNGFCIGLVTLNVPSTLNSLSLEMVDLMLDQLSRWQHQDDIACVLISGNGDKAFSAGGDIQALYYSSIENPGGPCAYAENFFEREYRLDYLIHTYPKPIIAWGHGVIMGGGLGVYAGCSHRIVTEKTRIAMPEITIGLFPDVGGSYFLNKMPGSTGRFLALTGVSINGADSLYLGLADIYIDHQLFQSTLDALMEISWSRDRDENSQSITNALIAISGGSSQGLAISQLAAHRETIDQVCEPWPTLAVLDNIKSLPSSDKWLADAKENLLYGSALSVLLADRQLQQSKHQSLKDVFCAELILSTNIVRHTEFAEGIRALIIDKDRSPRWQFKTPEEIPVEFLDNFFAAPWPKNPLIDL